MLVTVEKIQSLGKTEKRKIKYRGSRRILSSTQYGFTMSKEQKIFESLRFSPLRLQREKIRQFKLVAMRNNNGPKNDSALTEKPKDFGKT